MKKLPFKKIDCRLMEKLLLLPANALKVWLCHFNHEGVNRQSYPSLDRICAKTGLNLKTVKAQRKWLIDNGWLKKTGERHGSGQFKVPVVSTLEGNLPQGKADGRLKNRVPNTTVVQNSANGGRGPKLSAHETKTLPAARGQGLDPKVEPVEVNPLEGAPTPTSAPPSVSIDRRNNANVTSVSPHSQGKTVPELLAALPETSCTHTGLSSRLELTPSQVLDLIQNKLKGLHERRKDCVTQECRNDLDQRIAAAEWAVSQQQARMEKEGTAA